MRRGKVGREGEESRVGRRYAEVKCTDTGGNKEQRYSGLYEKMMNTNKKVHEIRLSAETKEETGPNINPRHRSI